MTARFDIEPLKTRTNLVLSIDTESLARYREDERGARFLAALRRAKVFGVDEAHQQNTAVITVRTSSLTRYYDVPKVAVQVLDTLYSMTDRGEVIPRMEMSHGVVDKDAGRYGMLVALRWPQIAPENAAIFATKHMQRFADSVNLNGSRRMNLADDMVYVGADRSRGIVIETNPLGSCNISAGGYDYNPESDIVELVQHNIYSPAQQLACLMGAVSFATAELHGVDK